MLTFLNPLGIPSLRAFFAARNLGLHVQALCIKIRNSRRASLCLFRTNIAFSSKRTQPVAPATVSPDPILLYSEAVLEFCLLKSDAQVRLNL